MAKIFLTGAAGLIGGDLLYALSKAHPDWPVRALVRNPEAGAKVVKAYPQVELVTGDLDQLDLIEEEASKADVVLNMANNHHVEAVGAIAKGLKKREAATGKPTYLIQISGASVLSAPEITAGTYGVHNSSVYDDLAGAPVIRKLIAMYPRRALDQAVTAASAADPNLHTALFFGPIIYGVGRGPVKTRSVQIPEMARVTLQTGKGMMVGEGKNTWGGVFVGDLSDALLRLTEEAVKGEVNPKLWDEEGLYFTEEGEMISFGEIASKVAKTAHSLGLIKDDTVVSKTPDEVNQIHPHGSMMWGTNARGRALRAKELLGWKPSGPSIDEEIVERVKAEAKALGLKVA